MKLLLLTAKSVRGTLFGWPGLESAILEYKLSPRNALPVAGPSKCFLGVQTQYAERSSSGRAPKVLFWSKNSVRGTFFRWPGLETTLLEYKLSTRNALPSGWAFKKPFWSTNSVRGTLFLLAGPSKCSFGVQTQYAERSSNGRAFKMLFWSTKDLDMFLSNSLKRCRSAHTMCALTGARGPRPRAHACCMSMRTHKV